MANNNFNGFFVCKNPNNEYDIEFSLQVPDQNVPKIFKKLYRQCEELKADLIKIFEKDEDKKKKYFEMLLTLSQAGLSGENADPILGLEALENLKNEIFTVEACHFKNRYMKKQGITAVIYIIILIFIYVSIVLINSFIAPDFISDFDIKNYILVFIGSLIGNWISFGVRKLDITFKDLVNFESDGLEHHIRLIFIGLVSVIFTMILNAKFFSISFNKIDLISLLSAKESAILLGIILGLLDNKLAVNLYSKSSAILKIK